MLDLERIAALAAACESVACLHPGDDQQISTVVGDRPLPGVAPCGDGIIIGVVGRYPTPAVVIAAEVRAAVRAAYPGLAIVVSIEDLHVDPPGADAEPPSSLS